MESGKIVESEVTSNFLVGLRERLISECEKEGVDNVICGFFIGDPETCDINTSLFGSATGEFIYHSMTCMIKHIMRELHLQDAEAPSAAVN